MLAIDWQLASVFGLCSLVFFAGTKGVQRANASPFLCDVLGSRALLSAVGNMQQKNIKAVLEATAEARGDWGDELALDCGAVS